MLWRTASCNHCGETFRYKGRGPNRATCSKRCKVLWKQRREKIRRAEDPERYRKLGRAAYRRKVKTKEGREAYNEYHRNYFREHYRNDPDFKKAWLKRNKENRDSGSST